MGGEGIRYIFHYYYLFLLEFLPHQQQIVKHSSLFKELLFSSSSPCLFQQDIRPKILSYVNPAILK